MNDTDIAIIGGGIGGLAAAWNIILTARQKNPSAVPRITVLEASDRFGGNVDTFDFTFGNGPDGTIDRWADLGVNDFNVTAYTNIVAVMNQIGFKAGTDYLPLEDSTSYSTGDGSICFADSASAWWGTAIDKALAASVNDFMQVAGVDATKNAGQFATTTISEYIDMVGPTRSPPWDARLGPQVIYPRINGMYFVTELGPRGMPFLAVMHYYAIQEGAGGKPANRCYFVGGASRWINQLVAYMTATMPEITFVQNYRASASLEDGLFTISNDLAPTSQPFRAKKLVLAAHADSSLIAVKQGLPGEVASAMASIEYTNGISVAHTDSRLLPVNCNAWSTYNILIHQPGAVAQMPYTINYVANRHQNDAQNPLYDKFGYPLFFVSVNPYRPIPDDLVLKDAQGNPAVQNLRHNVLDFATLQAQAVCLKNQGVNGIYYAGGWTQGAGLHEECWVQGQDVAKLILGETEHHEKLKALDFAELAGARLHRNMQPS
ncbi:FAD-dependent oxidoreductase [Paracoccus sp. PAR01]|uniref:FAD-dependent oxidoreductase n=1 Tax=Paracoccus sp. PAR01 TaxID=2769282 RepID=UPI0017836F5C|nr:FAD-dependent oxidoreductase [Paracoccus sp. PAR01]MBD9527453.1 FAD-dependent oxidoreductase [Paracoccus sp. PAR01]